MAEFAYKYIKPFTGGGLGDCKVGIIELSGTYKKGGIDVGLTQTPLFMATNDAYVAEIVEGKLILKTAGEELKTTPDIKNVKVFVVIKGAA